MNNIFHTQVNDGTSRPDWQIYFMRFAILASERSTCLARKVGAVIVRDRRIISTGYNGSPPGQTHCTEAGCLIEDGTDRCIRTIHAEQNAIIQAARHGVSTVGADLYTTCRPCTVCARMIAGAGITKMFYIGNDPTGWNAEVLQKAGIDLVKLEDI